MLIIEIREGENIDRALKRYKRKSINAGVIRELRNRREFKKPSIKRRQEVLKAQYREEKRRESDLG